MWKLNSNFVDQQRNLEFTSSEVFDLAGQNIKHLIGKCFQNKYRPLHFIFYSSKSNLKTRLLKS